MTIKLLIAAAVLSAIGQAAPAIPALEQGAGLLSSISAIGVLIYLLKSEKEEKRVQQVQFFEALNAQTAANHAIANGTEESIRILTEKIAELVNVCGRHTHDGEIRKMLEEALSRRSGGG